MFDPKRSWLHGRSVDPVNINVAERGVCACPDGPIKCPVGTLYSIMQVAAASWPLIRPLTTVRHGPTTPSWLLIFCKGTASRWNVLLSSSVLLPPFAYFIFSLNNHTLRYFITHTPISLVKICFIWFENVFSFQAVSLPSSPFAPFIYIHFK